MEYKSYQKFEDFDLSKKLQEAVLEARLECPTELQIQVIPLALANKDIIFEARSGMGKSACFAIPFLQHWLRERNRKGLIITPTADSVQQLGKVIGRLCPTLKARVLKFTSKDDYFYPEFHEKCPIVILEFGVAERFIKREKEFVSQVRSLGLDELDKLLAREKELESLLQPISSDRQTLICANELTEQIIEKGRWFCDPNRFEKVKLSRPEAMWDPNLVRLQYMLVNEETRFESLKELIRNDSEKIVMIITDSDRISRNLSEEFAKSQQVGEVLAYSMQLDAKQAIVDRVSLAGKGILIGCEAALNGVNISKIDHLISWELPSHLESYWKRLDRFACQGQIVVTVLVDQPRSGAIRILEKRLGRAMTAVGESFVSGVRAAGRQIGDRPHRASEKEIKSPSKVESTESEVQEAAVIIPTRFRQPVFPMSEELAKFAPEGFVKKSLGSKFVPAGKKRSGKPGER